MYSGNNKTALASQEQIAEAILTLLSRKPYAEISICELCKEAGISRQTFYSLFASKDNVMTFILQEHYRCDPELPHSHSCLEQLCRGFSHYIVAQRDFIRALVDNHIIYLLDESFRGALSRCDCFFSALDPGSRSYAVGFIASGFTGIARNYVTESPATDAESLARVCMELFGGRLLTNMEQVR